MGAGEYKDGPRGHIFLRQDYIRKILSNKRPDETRTAFIERCIDFTIAHGGDDFRNLIRGLSAGAPPPQEGQ